MAEDDDPINDRNNFKAGIFYYNPDDERLLLRVPGTLNRYIVNYGRWEVYLVMVAVLAIIGYALFFSGR